MARNALHFAGSEGEPGAGASGCTGEGLAAPQRRSARIDIMDETERHAGVVAPARMPCGGDGLAFRYRATAV
jgi:hypothetical protein